VICYEAADKRETPDLMTRFREEVYASSWGRAKDKVQRAGNSGNSGLEAARASARCEERRTLRSEYFKKKAKGRTAPKTAVRRLLDG